MWPAVRAGRSTARSLALKQTMSPELALKLVAILEAYFTVDEVRDLGTLFGLHLATLDGYEQRWLSVARELTESLERGNTRRLLDSLIDLAERRNEDGVAHSTWERQEFHRGMSPTIADAQKLLRTSASPSEITVSAGNVFSAKSMVRELLEAATGGILIVDPYVGVGTLDCLRSVTVPVRLLTGTQQNSVEAGFDRAVVAFCAEGHQLHVRRVQQLHDRHVTFNDRCWLIGGSLKDAGKKPFHCIEITDQKVLVVNDLEAKWLEGTQYP